MINNLGEVKCEWRFIPARAPWYGAIWERCIGIIKSGMKKVLGRALVTVEELHTVLLELEATVNDRPLGYTSGDLEEPIPITPSQLMYGRQLRPFPRHEITLEELNDPTLLENAQMSKRVKYISKLSNDLWKRWTSEYLMSLRETNKKMIARSGSTWPRVGDVVLIHDDGPRLLWRLGRVTKLLRGCDHLCRVVELRTEKGTTTRSIKNLYPLEVELGEERLSDGGGASISSPGTERADTAGSVVKSRTVRQSALKSSQLWQTLAHQGRI